MLKITKENIGYESGIRMNGSMFILFITFKKCRD